MKELLSRLTKRSPLVLAAACLAWLGTAVAQTPAAEPSPAAEPAKSGYSSWDVQFLYGSQFNEPFNPDDVAKGIITFENSSGWSWGSSYFFVDVLRSDSKDDNASEVYAEWYPSASLGKLTGKDLSAGFLRDISATMGINAGSKSTGAAPLVFLPGVTFDLNFPGFKFFSLGTYAYIDDGRLGGASNGCHNTTYQVTPSWSLPFNLGPAKFSFDGFIDFIGSHGDCVSQVLSQAQLKIVVGPRVSVGVEWQYWDNKFGIKDLKENFPQILVQWNL